MQYKQTLVRLFFLLLPFAAFSQVTTYLPQDARENILLERLEIKAQTDSILNFSKTKPFGRRHLINSIWRPNEVISPAYGLDKIRAYNIYRALSDNLEFLPDSVLARFTSQKTFL